MHSYVQLLQGDGFTNCKMAEASVFIDIACFLSTIHLQIKSDKATEFSQKTDFFRETNP